MGWVLTVSRLISKSGTSDNKASELSANMIVSMKVMNFSTHDATPLRCDVARANVRITHWTICVLLKRHFSKVII